MEILYHGKFLKNYHKRVFLNKKLRNQFEKRTRLFIEDPSREILKDHSLRGKKLGFRVFSISGDWRVVYKLISQSKVLFLDIGTHNQVY